MPFKIHTCIRCMFGSSSVCIPFADWCSRSICLCMWKIFRMCIEPPIARAFFPHFLFIATIFVIKIENDNRIDTSDTKKKFRLEFRRKFTTTFFSLDSPLNGNTPIRCQYEKKKNQTLWFVAQNHSNNNQMKSHNQDIAFVCACRSRQNHIFDWNFKGEWILLYFFRLSHFVFRSLSFYLAWFDHLHFQTKLNPSLLQTCTAESHTFIYNQLSIGSRCVHTRNKKFNSSSITSHIQSN